MKRYFLLFMITALAVAVPAIAADISVEAHAEKKSITVGDPIHYTITLQYPAGMKLQSPEKVTELGEWSVSDVKVSVPVDKKGQSAQAVDYTLISFSTGAITVPALTLTVTDAQGTASTVTVDSTTIPVQSVLERFGDQGDIRDIKPPLSLTNPWIWIIALLLLAAAGALYYFYLQRRRAQQANGGIPAEPPRPPNEVAMEELDKLARSGLVEEGRIKEYYIALSDIVRLFLGRVYTIETEDRTTSEIFAQLRNKVTDLKITMPVRSLFDQCDLVKFAKYRPEPAECLKDLAAARTIVTLVNESVTATLAAITDMGAQ